MNVENMLLKEARHRRPHPVGFHLYAISRIALSIEIGYRFVVARGWEDGALGSNCLVGTGADFRIMEIFWN